MDLGSLIENSYVIWQKHNPELPVFSLTTIETVMYVPCRHIVDEAWDISHYDDPCDHTESSLKVNLSFPMTDKEIAAERTRAREAAERERVAAEKLRAKKKAAAQKAAARKVAEEQRATEKQLKQLAYRARKDPEFAQRLREITGDQ